MSQHGGLKVINMLMLEEEKASCVTSKGRIVRLNVDEIPLCSNEEVYYLGEYVNLEEGERLVDVLKGEGDYLLMVTTKGKIKLCRRHLLGSRSRKLIGLVEGETLLKASFVTLETECLLFTSDRALKFSVGTLRISNFGSGGVRGVRAESKLVGSFSGTNNDRFVLVRDGGFGYVDSLSSYPLQRYGGKGLNVRWRDRKVVGIGRRVNSFFCMMEDGRVIRTDLGGLRTSRRTNKGVRLVDVSLSKILTSV